VFHHHSRKKANNNVQKQFSLNSGVMAIHRPKTANVRSVVGAHDTPPGPDEHTTLQLLSISYCIRNCIRRFNIQAHYSACLVSNW
jgi:hypothetical protein